MDSTIKSTYTDSTRCRTGDGLEMSEDSTRCLLVSVEIVFVAASFGAHVRLFEYMSS